MVDTAASLWPGTFESFTEEMDTRLARDPGRLGRPSVRRAYARATFRYERDPGLAETRLAYEPGIERTPAEQVAEAARTASALADFGLVDRAREILTKMHADGLGYSRAARKDPQYLLWKDLLSRACDEDPSGRPARLQFFARLLVGMADTEGSDAGGRLAPAFVDQAAHAGPAWARAAADFVEEIGLAAWRDLAAGILTGVAKCRTRPHGCVECTVWSRRAALWQ